MDYLRLFLENVAEKVHGLKLYAQKKRLFMSIAIAFKLIKARVLKKEKKLLLSKIAAVIYRKLVKQKMATFTLII